jgi:tRNA C32,U32 (ribose-2'-O)-methylase TrmJ
MVDAGSRCAYGGGARGAAGGAAAFVFGNEQAGLTNEEMLAADPRAYSGESEFSSLNLAQAVQVSPTRFSWFQCISNEAKARQPFRTATALRAPERAAVESKFFDPATGSKLPTLPARCSRVPDLSAKVNILRAC